MCDVCVLYGHVCACYTCVAGAWVSAYEFVVRAVFLCVAGACARLSRDGPTVIALRRNTPSPHRFDVLRSTGTVGTYRLSY